MRKIDQHNSRRLAALRNTRHTRRSFADSWTFRSNVDSRIAGASAAHPAVDHYVDEPARSAFWDWIGRIAELLGWNPNAATGSQAQSAR